MLSFWASCRRLSAPLIACRGFVGHKQTLCVQGQPILCQALCRLASSSSSVRARIGRVQDLHLSALRTGLRTCGCLALISCLSLLTVTNSLVSAVRTTATARWNPRGRLILGTPTYAGMCEYRSAHVIAMHMSCTSAGDGLVIVQENVLPGSSCQPCTAGVSMQGLDIALTPTWTSLMST